MWLLPTINVKGTWVPGTIDSCFAATKKESEINFPQRVNENRGIDLVLLKVCLAPGGRLASFTGSKEKQCQPFDDG